MTVDAQDLSPQAADVFSTMYPTGSSEYNKHLVEPHDVDHNSPHIPFDVATTSEISCLLLSPTDTRGYINRPSLRCLFVVAALYITQSFFGYIQAYTLVHIVYRSNRTFTSSNFISSCTYRLSTFNPLSIGKQSNIPYHYDFKHSEYRSPKPDDLEHRLCLYYRPSDRQQ